MSIWMPRGQIFATACVAAACAGALTLGGCNLIKDPDANNPNGDPSPSLSGAPDGMPTAEPTGPPTAFDKSLTVQFPESDVLDTAMGEDIVLTLTAGEVTARSLPDLDTAYKLSVGDGRFADLWTEAGVGYTLEVASNAGSGTEVGDDEFTVSRFDLETGEVGDVATAVVPQNAEGASRFGTGRIVGVSDDTVVVDSYVPGAQSAHTALALDLPSGRQLWRARPAQVLTVTGDTILINTGRRDVSGSIKALDMESGDVRWSALRDTLGASAIGTTDKRVVIARDDSVFEEPTITSLSLRTGHAHPAEAADSWDWHCTATSGAVAVCTLADVERVVGWNLELNREEWSLPTRDRFAPIVTLVQDDLVYGLLDNGTALVLDALTGDDIATDTGAGPAAVNDWGGVLIYSGVAYFLPYADGPTDDASGLPSDQPTESPSDVETSPPSGDTI